MKPIQFARGDYIARFFNDPAAAPNIRRLFQKVAAKKGKSKLATQRPATWGEMHRRISGYRLSSKLDDLLEFRAGFVSPENIKNVFGRSGVGGGLKGLAEGMRSKYAGLASHAGSSAIAGPRAMPQLSPGHYPAVEKMFSKFAAARSAANPAIKGPVEGAVKSAATGAYGVTSRTFPSMRSPGQVAKPASMRIAAASPSGAQQVAEKAGQEAAQAGAAKPMGWKAGAIGTGIGVGAGALLLAPHGQRQEQEQFSLLLDALIEFKYPAAVLESSWRKWNKPSRKTLGGILKRHDERGPGMPTMVFRNQPHMFAARDYVTKYPKEVLQSVWKKLKKPRKPSPYAQSFHGGEYHDDPKWVNKDIKKSRKENKGLSARLDDIIEFGPATERITEAMAKFNKPKIGSWTGGHLVGAGLAGLAGIGIIGSSLRKQRENKRQLSSRLDDLINFADPRPRNPLGEFAPQNAGGPDPNAMATVYKMPQPQPQSPSLTQGASAALVGGALGAVGGNIGKTAWSSSAKAIKRLAAKRKLASAIPK